jgi:hypothetical protein
VKSIEERITSFPEDRPFEMVLSGLPRTWPLL